MPRYSGNARPLRSDVRGIRPGGNHHQARPRLGDRVTGRRRVRPDPRGRDVGPGPRRAVVRAAAGLVGCAVFATTSWRHVGPPVAYFDNRFSGPR